MINRKALLFFITIMASSMGTNLFSFSFSSLSPFAFATRIHCKAFGTEDASFYYKDKIHEFLSYIDIKDSDTLNVRKLEFSTDILQANSSCSSFIAIALWTGIWVNESKLEKMAEEEKIWTLALAVAQYKLTRALTNVVWAQVLPWTAGLANVAAILVALPVMNLCKANGSKAALAILVGLLGARLSLMLYSSFVQQWYACFKQRENEAHLLAAQLLCEHEYFATFEKHVQNFAAAGKDGVLNEVCAPLTEFLNKWRADHPA